MKVAHVKNVSGLREKPTYEELINYIETNNNNIKMPDRRAQMIRRSFYLSQLDGEGLRRQEEMEKMQEAVQDRELLVRQFARDYGFNYRDIDRWIEGQRITPVRREQLRPGSPMGGQGQWQAPEANVGPLEEARRSSLAIGPRGAQDVRPAGPVPLASRTFWAEMD